MIFELPMPPSENNAYPTNKQGRRFPGKALKEYHAAMEAWRMENLGIANAARKFFVSSRPSEQRALIFRRSFGFPREKLVTLAGLPQKLDATNRVKLFDDAVCKFILGIDDCWVIGGYVEKWVVPHGESERAILEISAQDFKQWADPLPF